MKKLKNKEINFYSRFLLAEEQKKEKKKSLKKIIIIYGVSVAAVLGIIVAGSFLIRSGADRALEEAKTNLNNSEMVQKLSEDKVLSHGNTAYESIIALYDENNQSVQNTENVLKMLSPKLMEKLLACQTANMTIKSVVFDGRKLTISCISDFADSSSEFVKRLENTGLFEDIDYGGFIEQGSGYVFTLDAVFPHEIEEVTENGQQ